MYMHLANKVLDETGVVGGSNMFLPQTVKPQLNLCHLDLDPGENYLITNLSIYNTGL